MALTINAFQAATPAAGAVQGCSPSSRSYECIGTEFCCVVGGKTCIFSVENEAGRRYACALMIKYGDWDTVVSSPEYKPIGDVWARNGTLPFNYCQTFDPAFCCRPEYRNGRTSEAVSIGNLG